VGKLLFFPADAGFPHCGYMPILSNKYIITGWLSAHSNTKTIQQITNKLNDDQMKNELDPFLNNIFMIRISVQKSLCVFSLNFQTLVN
jgi:TATA-box binding protein (TBP) (component of TFIID and TFIIIB)